MNVRIPLAVLLLIFAIPFANAVWALDAEQVFKIICVLGYLFNATYLLFTGYNLTHYGRAFGPKK